MLTIIPSPPLRGVVRLPGDKSISHRAALFAALAEGESRISNFLDAGVTRRMLAALTELGVRWTLDGTTLSVSGSGLAGLQPPDRPLDCGNSATTLRLLAGAVAAAGIPAILDGSAGLRRRPMARIIDPLRQMGVAVDSADGRAPLAFQARTGRLLSGGRFDLPVASAQVKTCLLLAALGSPEAVTLLEPGPSRDHSERMLRRMGLPVENRLPAAPGAAYETQFIPEGPLRPLDLDLPGDFSSGAFLIAAALITPGSDITLENIGLNPTRTGLLDAFQAMGADIEIQPDPDDGWEPRGNLRIRCSDLKGTEIAGDLVVRMIDEFPAFAAAAAYAAGPTTVREAEELRHKESDRITALCTQLQSIGVPAEEFPDGFRLPGAGHPPAGGLAAANGDHRIAMALAVAGLAAAGPVVLKDPAIIRESFPAFFPILERLGAHLD